MKAKIKFWMKDRNEYEFIVEGDGQNDWYDCGTKMLDAHLSNLSGNAPVDLSDKFFTVEGWKITPLEDVDGLPTDKKDGISIRSSLQKVRFDLLPTGPMVQIAQVFTFGSYHYGDRNWENGFSYSRCIGAIIRHITKWCMGADLDEESKLPHLAHACANLMFLIEFQLSGKGNDDRIKYTDEVIQLLFKPLNCEIKDDEDESV